MMRRQKLFIIMFLFSGLTSCSEASKQEGPINHEKASSNSIDKSKAKVDAIALATAWLKNGQQSNGFHKTKFNEKWEGIGDNSRIDLTSQARLTYIYASAYKLSNDFKFLHATTRAADFMVIHMRNEKDNAWYNSINKNGLKPQQKAKAYAYSFVIFSLSHAYEVSKDESYKELALKTWKSNAWLGLKHSKHYFINNKALNMPASNAWYQNPFMHLYEALLSLYIVTNDKDVLNDIKQMTHFIDDKLSSFCDCIPEYFNSYDGAIFPQHYDNGSHVDIGHQIEWSYLINRAVDIGLDAKYRKLAQKLFYYAIRFGLAPDTGALYSESTLNGAIKRKKIGWWQQAELLRASAYYAMKTDNYRYKAIYLKAEKYVDTHLVDHKNGGWNSSGKVTGSMNKVIGYHAMAYYMSILNKNIRSN